MNLRVSSSLLLVAAFPASVLAADVPAASDPLIEFSGRTHIERGMNRETVRAMLGAPSAWLSPDVWVYFDFQARRPAALRVNIANPENHDTLVVAFTKDRVALIRLCDGGPVRGFLAQQGKGKRAAPAIAAK